PNRSNPQVVNGHAPTFAVTYCHPQILEDLQSTCPHLHILLELSKRAGCPIGIINTGEVNIREYNESAGIVLPDIAQRALQVSIASTPPSTQIDHYRHVEFIHLRQQSTQVC